MVVKHLGALGAAAVFSLLVFIAMQLMIANDGLFEKPDSDRTYLDFVRVDRNLQDTQTKDRRIPDPPKPPENPPPPEAQADFQKNSTQNNLNMDMPNISTSLSGGDGPSLGGLSGGNGGMNGFDADIIPIVRVQPKYPQRALQARLTGTVLLDVWVAPDGSVSDAKVIESNPPRIFDKAALNAIKRWKFRPRIVDGQPQAQRGKLPMEFNL